MKIALLGDLHVGCHDGLPVFAEAQKTFISDVFIPKLEKAGVKHVLQVGDIVDYRKGITYVTMNRFRNDILTPLLEAEIDLHILVGNHDVPYKDTLHPNAPNELCMGYPVTVYDRPTEATIGDLDCVVTPWICKENVEATHELIERTNRRVAFGHYELAGFDMYKGSTCLHGMKAKILSKFDFVGSGHFHQPSTSGNIHYLGAPSQYTWGDADCPRGFWLFDTKTFDAEFIPNPDKMFIKVPYADDKEMPVKELRNKYVKVYVKSKKDPFKLDNYIRSLEKNGAINVRVIESDVNDEPALSNEVDESDVSGETDHMHVVHEYIDKMTVTEQNKHLDKNRLEDIISAALREAITV